MAGSHFHPISIRSIRGVRCAVIFTPIKAKRPWSCGTDGLRTANFWLPEDVVVRQTREMAEVPARGRMDLWTLGLWGDMAASLAVGERLF